MEEQHTKPKIRPADEETGTAWFAILFSVLWYALGLKTMVGGPGINGILILVAGLIPLYSGIQGFRRALFYRNQRKAAIALGKKARGRITEVYMDVRPYETENETRYRRYYYLKVEMTDPNTGMCSEITSQTYRRPIHRYLASNKVTVYTDESGWKHYLEDFQWKKSKKEPDVFACPQEFDAYQNGERVTRVLFIVVFILVLLWGFLA